jgi:hypothetical protein
MVVPEGGGDQRRVGERRIAHPQPHPAILLDHRVAADHGGARDQILAGNFDALA